MNFQRGRQREMPEINLIPLIDVLLVILIFLMVTTTYARYSELKINLPTASTQPSQQKPDQIRVGVTQGGRYEIDGAPVGGATVAALAAGLAQAAKGKNDAIVVIDADALATQQSVVNVMVAAQQVGLDRISFATQNAQ